VPRKKYSELDKTKTYHSWKKKYQSKSHNDLIDAYNKEREWDKSWIPHEFTMFVNTSKKKALADTLKEKRIL
jgi:hypothetical protein